MWLSQGGFAPEVAAQDEQAMTTEQLTAFPVACDEVRFTLQEDGNGSACRIEAFRGLDPRARAEAMKLGLLKLEFSYDRPRYRRRFSNPLRAYQAMIHIYNLDQHYRPSLFGGPIETCVDVDRLMIGQPKLGEAKAKRLMRDAMPFCAIPTCDVDDPLEIHHIHGRKPPDPHRLTNLITLCCNHHKQAQDHLLPAEVERLWVQVVNADRLPVEHR